jgi:hypothetical protein
MGMITPLVKQRKPLLPLALSGIELHLRRQK